MVKVDFQVDTMFKNPSPYKSPAELKQMLSENYEKAKNIVRKMGGTK